MDHSCYSEGDTPAQGENVRLWELLLLLERKVQSPWVQPEIVL